MTLSTVGIGLFQSLNTPKGWHRNLNSCGPKQQTSFFENSREAHSCHTQLSCACTHTHTGQVHLDTRWAPFFIGRSTWKILLGYSCALLCSKHKQTGMRTHMHKHIFTHCYRLKKRWKQTALFFLWQLSEGLTTTLPTCIALISDVTFE